MKRFLAKIVLLSTLVMAIAVLLALTAYRATPKKDFGAEVYRAIRVCTTANPTAKTLVLGDSVAYQLFGVRLHDGADDDYLDGVAVAASNQAITPLGNRILLDRWLALNPQAEKVVYCVLPQSLTNDGARKFTFHYLICPFLETGLLDGNYPEIIRHLGGRFGRLVFLSRSLRNLLYRNSKLYDFYESNIVRVPEPDQEGGVPDFALQQLKAMQAACESRGISLRLAFPPLSARPTAKLQERLEKQLGGTFPEIHALFAAIRVEPKRKFKDKVHFTREHLTKIRGPVRAQVLGIGGAPPENPSKARRR